MRVYFKVVKVQIKSGSSTNYIPGTWKINTCAFCRKCGANVSARTKSERNELLLIGTLTLDLQPVYGIEANVWHRRKVHCPPLAGIGCTFQLPSSAGKLQSSIKKKSS